jgi:hypothetical protein
LGFKISWIGFRGLSKEDALRSLNAVDTRERDEANEAPFSGAEIPGGWFVLFANDFSFASEDRLARLSENCEVVACQVHEGVMVAVSYGYERGQQKWAILHDAQQDLRHIEVTGTPPTAFAQVRERLLKEQDQHDGQEPGVDFVFDVPLETATSVCPYKHDRWRFDWGEPCFTVLELA